LEEANKIIVSIIPELYRPKLGNEEEFILQLNRPKISQRVDNLKMNLITKWSVERLQMFWMQTPTGPGTHTASTPTAIPGEVITASISFDNNNVPTSSDKALPSGYQSSLLLEALGYAELSLREGRLNIKGFTNGKLIH